MVPLARLWPLAAVLSSLVACGGEDDDLYTDAGTYNCAAETRAEAFLAGMTKTGAGGVEVTLTSAAPAPPARGDNTWSLSIQYQGAPAADAAVTVTPFMPDHRHGSPITPVVTPSATAGDYDVTPVNLWMPGLWEITVGATPTGGTQDSVVFRFCITG